MTERCSELMQDSLNNLLWSVFLLNYYEYIFVACVRIVIYARVLPPTDKNIQFLWTNEIFKLNSNLQRYPRIHFINGMCRYIPHHGHVGWWWRYLTWMSLSVFTFNVMWTYPAILLKGTLLGYNILLYYLENAENLKGSLKKVKSKLIKLSAQLLEFNRTGSRFPCTNHAISLLNCTL